MIRILLLLLVLAAPAQAQDLGIGSLTEGLGEASGLAQRVVQILVLVTVLSLVPGIAMMVTCFPFIVTVLAILRQGIGLQQSPPNMLIVSIALFLTWFVMEPVFGAAWTNGVEPFNAGVLGVEEAFLRVMEPFRAFMLARMDGDTFTELQSLRPATAGVPAEQAGLSVIIPAFMLSELQRAFEVGFLIFLPFLVIDLVVAAILMSMGMMMVPPAIVSLPFKLAFFVVADGWSLIAGALVQSYM